MRKECEKLPSPDTDINSTHSVFPEKADWSGKTSLSVEVFVTRTYEAGTRLRKTAVRSHQQPSQNNLISTVENIDMKHSSRKICCFMSSQEW